jgi:SAM-dependent methyltransferase
VESIIALWREHFHIDARPDFEGVRDVEQCECAECGIAFFVPQELAGSANLYDQLSNFEWYYPVRKWEYNTALDDLKKCERILEVGCGTGNFITLARGAGHKLIEGIELSAAAVKGAVALGLPVQEITIRDAAERTPGAYDAVCIFQVLEHIAKPKEFLEACCTLLRPGGRLILAVPNQDSYIRHLCSPLDLPPHHMTRWTSRSLHKLPVNFSLQIVRIVQEPLVQNQFEWWTDAYLSALKRTSLAFVAHPWVRSRIVRLLRLPAINRWLNGQNIYACYVRTSERLST